MDANELRALADALPEGVHWSDPITPDMLAEAIKRFCADAQPVAAVPAGWKLVPVEPTPEMLSAVGMMDGYDWHAPGCSPDADHANWYSAMIAAAPAVPQAEPKREPLTLEQIDSLIERLFYHLRYESNRVLWEHAVSIVRAVERAAYKRAVQECKTVKSKGGWEDYDDACNDCIDAIRALGRQHD